MVKTPKGGRKQDKNFLSPQELALLMGLSRQTVRNWISKGDIKANHVGRNFNIPVDEVVRILKRYRLPVPDWLKDWYSRR